VKVVLFCGGEGMRLREYSESVPKPMVPIGARPILWHVMRYYAHFGHCDFIICLGYKGDVIKRYFLDYDETITNDFTLSGATREVEMLRSDIDDWRITFVDTGLASSVGERLHAVRAHLEGEEMFLANYGDTLTDAALPQIIEPFERSDCTATFLAVRPRYSFHIVSIGEGDIVNDVSDVTRAGMWVNGGYFVLRHDIFDHLGPGRDLVVEGFHALIARRKLLAYRHEGFWAPMDTLKERQELETAHATGQPPWAVWQSRSDAG
jgi:glucose-1-phosphate cytidylyltransferase